MADHNHYQEAVRNPYMNYSCQGNLGLLYTRRYYGEINMDVLNNTDIKTKIKPDGKDVNTKHQIIYYESRNSNIIEEAKQFAPPDPMPNATLVELTTTYPGLLTGVGIPHAAKHDGEAMLGIVFDHTTGLPCIPGSSVKGLLRSMFPLQDLDLADKCEKKAKEKDRNETEKLRKKAVILREKAAEKQQFIIEFFDSLSLSGDDVFHLERSIFDGMWYDQRKKQYVASGCLRDVFFDALPTKATNGLLTIDNITPHTKGEFANPVPITLMHIAPGVTLRFEFGLHNTVLPSGTCITASEKSRLFSAILTTIGIGAKTNVGYGQLKEA